MSKQCIGCGVIIQNDEMNKIGYSPKENSDLCQRCFRIQHYDDLTISMKLGISGDEVMEKINKMDALICWVVDLFDFESNLIESIQRHLFKKDIIMIATKRDLLPPTCSNEKLGSFIKSRLKDKEINVKGVVVCGDYGKDGKEEILKAIHMYREGRDVVIMGHANAGKSTILNALMEQKALTTSRYPGTTLDFNPIKMDHYTIYDTPGLVKMNNLLSFVNESDLKVCLLQKTVKPRVYQIRGDQSFAIGGLIRLDCMDAASTSVVFYCSDRLNIHRGKVENADELWNTHYGEILSPCLPVELSEFHQMCFNKLPGDMDIVIYGLGWVSIHGDVSSIKVSIYKEVKVDIRKAML